MLDKNEILTDEQTTGFALELFQYKYGENMTQQHVEQRCFDLVDNITQAAVKAYQDSLASKTDEEMKKMVAKSLNQLVWETDELKKYRTPTVDDIVILHHRVTESILPLLTSVYQAHQDKNIEKAKAVKRERDRILTILNANKVLLQPREGYTTLMINEKQWQSLSNPEEEVNVVVPKNR